MGPNVVERVVGPLLLWSACRKGSIYPEGRPLAAARIGTGN
ncbi:MAG: hypothetical protein ACTS6J_17165 [Burkholderiales bacterium]